MPRPGRGAAFPSRVTVPRAAKHLPASQASRAQRGPVRPGRASRANQNAPGRERLTAARSARRPIEAPRRTSTTDPMTCSRPPRRCLSLSCRRDRGGDGVGLARRRGAESSAASTSSARAFGLWRSERSFRVRRPATGDRRPATSDQPQSSASSVHVQP